MESGAGGGGLFPTSFSGATSFLEHFVCMHMLERLLNKFN